MKRILMLVFNDMKHDARVTKEAATLAAGGFDVTVLALSGLYEELPQKEERDGFVIERVKRFGSHRSKPSRFKQITQFVTWFPMLIYGLRKSIDVIHAHDANTLLVGYIMAKLKRLPLVYDAHEIATQRVADGMKKHLFAWIEKTASPMAKLMMTTTYMRAEFFTKEYSLKRPVFVLQNRPHFVEDEKLHGNQLLRQNLKIQNDWPIVLYQGMLQSGRGMRNIIATAEQVPQANFVFLGMGPQEAEVKQLIIERKLSDRVYVHPMVTMDVLHKYTSSADLGLQVLRNTCLNHYSTDSNKLFEYIMSGLPVVASNFPEIQRVIDEHQVGIAVDPHDVAQIRDAIQTIIGDPSVYQSYKDRVNQVRQSLSWEVQAKEFVATYKNAIESAHG